MKGNSFPVLCIFMIEIVHFNLGIVEGYFT